MAYTQEYLKHCKNYKIDPLPEYVVCAAIKLKDETIICGARHWDKIMCDIADKLRVLEIDCGNAEQGFINQWGVFLSREEAMNIVKKNGQKFNRDRNGRDDILFSEGLYL